MNIKWLIGAVTVDPSGPRLPDVLVHRCQRRDSSPGFCEGLSGWTDGAEEVAERSAVPHYRLPLTLSFSLSVTVSRLLMPVSDDYTYPRPVPSHPMAASLGPHVPLEINLS